MLPPFRDTLQRSIVERDLCPFFRFPRLETQWLLVVQVKVLPPFMDTLQRGTIERDLRGGLKRREVRRTTCNVLCSLPQGNGWCASAGALAVLRTCSEAVSWPFRACWVSHLQHFHVGS